MYGFPPFLNQGNEEHTKAKKRAFVPSTNKAILSLSDIFGVPNRSRKAKVKDPEKPKQRLRSKQSKQSLSRGTRSSGERV